MLRHYLSVAALLGASILTAQNDTAFTVITQESGSLQQQHFADPFDYVFLRDQPVKALFKWNQMAIVPMITTDDYYFSIGEGQLDWRLEVAGEVAVGKRFSLNASAYTAFAGNEHSFFDYLHLGIEPRWYMDRIPAAQKSANLSGKYLSFSTEARLNLYDNPNTRGNDRRWSQWNSIRAGIQRRLFKQGYFDINAGAGMRSENRLTVDSDGNILANDRTWRHFLDLRMGIGWALSTPKAAKTAVPACELIQCYREEKRLFRIDLLRLLPVFDNDVQTVRLSVGYEQKIGSSPWSVLTEISVPYSNSTDSSVPENQRGNDKTYGIGLFTEPRYYFTLKHRIASGESGNNLSGFFLGLNGGIRHIIENSYMPTFLDYPVSRTNTSVRVVPVLGIQFRIFKNLFIEDKIGLGWEQSKDYRQYHLGQEIRTPWDSGFVFLSELKIGLAF